LDRNKLDVFKEKSAELRKKAIEATVELKDMSIELSKKAIETGSRVSRRVSITARETGSRLSVTAKEAGSRLSVRASRHFSIGSRTRSFRLENGKYGYNVENSSSSTRDNLRFDDDISQFDGDNVRVPSDIEEKEEEPGRTPGNSVVNPQDSTSAAAKDDAKTTEPETTVIPTIEQPTIPKFRPTKPENGWNEKNITWSRLHEAMLTKRWDEVCWLINKGVNIKKWKGILGETSLHEACMRRAPSTVVKSLINAGAEVNAVTVRFSFEFS
jgi:hypothetical protein